MSSISACIDLLVITAESIRIIFGSMFRDFGGTYSSTFVMGNRISFLFKPLSPISVFYCRSLRRLADELSNFEKIVLTNSFFFCFKVILFSFVSLFNDLAISCLLSCYLNMTSEICRLNLRKKANLKLSSGCRFAMW